VQYKKAGEVHAKGFIFYRDGDEAKTKKFYELE